MGGEILRRVGPKREGAESAGQPDRGERPGVGECHLPGITRFLSPDAFSRPATCPMRGIEQIPRLYDALMWVFDGVALGGWRRSLMAPMEGATPHPPRVLDLGCGTGRNLSLAQRDTRAPRRTGATLIGLDPDRAMLRAARRRAPGVPLVQARAEALPFRDDAFQLVISSLVFCSVDDPARGLGEVARVLRPGGTLRMLEHVRPRSRLGAWLARRVQPAWTALAGGCRPDRDTEAAVRHAGFRVDPGSRRARWILRRFDAVPDKARTGAPRPPPPPA